MPASPCPRHKPSSELGSATIASCVNRWVLCPPTPDANLLHPLSRSPPRFLVPTSTGDSLVAQCVSLISNENSLASVPLGRCQAVDDDERIAGHSVFYSLAQATPPAVLDRALLDRVRPYTVASHPPILLHSI